MEIDKPTPNQGVQESSDNIPAQEESTHGLNDDGNSSENSSPEKAYDDELSSDNLTVIGLGASAGGLAALRAFFAEVPANTALTFVVIVHLSPEHESILAELLQGYSTIPVTQVQTRTKMQPNHVYVIPPAKRLV